MESLRHFLWNWKLKLFWSFPNCHHLLRSYDWEVVEIGWLGSRRNTWSLITKEVAHFHYHSLSSSASWAQYTCATRGAWKAKWQMSTCSSSIELHHKATHKSQWKVSEKLYLLISSGCHRLKCCSFSCKRKKNVHSFENTQNVKHQKQNIWGRASRWGEF